MSKYTTEVRFICENYAGMEESAGYNSVNEIIKRAIPQVFNFEFPIFDEAYREVLCGKILKHYYTREIGQETVGLWKLFLDTKLNEIMPYYNQMYESERLNIKPFEDYKLNKTSKKTVNENRDKNDETKSNGSNTAEQSGTTNGKSYDLYSDTPQGALTGVESEEYLTNARKETNEGISTANSTGSSEYEENKTSTDKLKGTEDYIEEITGKLGTASYSTMLKEFRDTFLNIDMLIIDELEELFFGLY